MALSHPELVQIAADWARTVMMAQVVIEEGYQRWGSGERADVLFIKDGQLSGAVECKTSLSDFHADHEKSWRQTDQGMGEYRYYCCEPGIIGHEHLNDSGWGLLLVNQDRDGKFHLLEDQESSVFVPDLKAERNLLSKAYADVHFQLSPRQAKGDGVKRTWASEVIENVTSDGCFATEAVIGTDWKDHFPNRGVAVRYIEGLCEKRVFAEVTSSVEGGKLFLRLA